MRIVGDYNQIITPTLSWSVFFGQNYLQRGGLNEYFSVCLFMSQLKFPVASKKRLGNVCLVSLLSAADTLLTFISLSHTLKNYNVSIVEGSIE